MRSPPAHPALCPWSTRGGERCSPSSTAIRLWRPRASSGSSPGRRASATEPSAIGSCSRRWARRSRRETASCTCRGHGSTSSLHASSATPRLSSRSTCGSRTRSGRDEGDDEGRAAPPRDAGPERDRADRARLLPDTLELVGYLVISRYVDAWHVMNVAVAAEHRRRGIATMLLERLFEATAGRGRRGYTLEVRVSNAGAVALYERLGFKPRGVRRGYYTDNREDALIMWKDPVIPDDVVN